QGADASFPICEDTVALALFLPTPLALVSKRLWALISWHS
ncbi:hypothetical protein PSYJA_38239, partial [Pseudomonas syringae pv. japonica str. M301072]